MATRITKQRSRSAEVEFLSRMLHVGGVRIQVDVPAGPGAEAELDRACRETEDGAQREALALLVERIVGDYGANAKGAQFALVRKWLDSGARFETREKHGGRPASASTKECRGRIAAVHRRYPAMSWEDATNKVAQDMMRPLKWVRRRSKRGTQKSWCGTNLPFGSTGAP